MAHHIVAKVGGTGTKVIVISNHSSFIYIVSVKCLYVS